MVAGCSKKRNDSSVNHFKPSNTITTTQPAKSIVTDSEDIFSEFYKDENTSIKKENLSSKGTLTSSDSNGDYKPSYTHDGRYVIQISTVQSYSFAEKIKDKLEKAGYPVYVAEVQNPTPALNGTYYRVRVGAFSTFSDAKKFADTVLKSIGYDYWIDNKSNDLVGIDGNSFGNSGSSYSNSVFSPAGTSTSSSASDTSTNAPQESPSRSISNSSSATDNWVSSSNTTVDSTSITTDTVQSSKSPSGSTTNSTTPSQPSNSSDNHDTKNNDTSSDWGSNGW